MRRLLRPDREVERLERHGPAPMEALDDRDDRGRERQRPHVVAQLPGVADAQPVIALDDALGMPGEHHPVLVVLQPREVGALIERLHVRPDGVDELQRSRLVDDQISVTLEALSIRLAQDAGHGQRIGRYLSSSHCESWVR